MGSHARPRGGAGMCSKTRSLGQRQSSHLPSAYLDCESAEQLPDQSRCVDGLGWRRLICGTLQFPTKTGAYLGRAGTGISHRDAPGRPMVAEAVRDMPGTTVTLCVAS